MTGQAVAVRPMEERDLDGVDHVMRLAFGTEFRLPDPLSFAGDVDLIRPRWRSDNTACFVAEADAAVVGSVVVSFWGSLAVLGPLTVHPDRWNAGVARALMPVALDAADRARRRRHRALHASFPARATCACTRALVSPLAI